MDKEQGNKIIHEGLGHVWPDRKIHNYDYLGEDPLMFEAIQVVIHYTFEDGENAYFRTFGLIYKETGEYMVRINRHGFFKAKSMRKAIWLALVDFFKNRKTQAT